MLSGEIAQIQTPDRENASYTLEFPGYRVACISNVANITKEAFYGHDSDRGIVAFDVHWSGIDGFNDSDPVFVMRYFDRLEVTMQTNVSADSIEEVAPGTYLFHPDPFDAWNPNATYKGQYHITTCRPLPELYVVNVSYERSKRQIRYTTRDHQSPKPSYYANYAPDQSELEFWEGSSSNKTIHFPPAFEQILQTWEKWGVLDASLGALKYICRTNSYSFQGSEDLSVATWKTYGCRGTSKSIFSCRVDFLDSRRYISKNCISRAPRSVHFQSPALQRERKRRVRAYELHYQRADHKRLYRQCHHICYVAQSR